MIREKVTAKQLSRMEVTEGEMRIALDVSDRRFSTTQDFEACDSNWRIEMHGTEFDTIGFSMTNLSAESMRTKYAIIVKNQTSTGDDHIWRDPDGILIFSPFGTVDDSWGSDEIISFRTLHTVTGLCVRDSVHIMIKISIFNTSDEINVKRKHDLRIPTDAKIKSLEGTYRDEFCQQDILVSRRLNSFEQPTLTSGHYHVSETSIRDDPDFYS